MWIENEGSPLTVYTQKFADRLQKKLGDGYLVKIGMRYAEPTIKNALQELAAAEVTSIVLAPLFPQYAEATTESSLKEMKKQMSKMNLQTSTQTMRPFFAAKEFIDPSVQIIREALKNKKPDHYLFSFHGLPESHIRKIEGCLISDGCCFAQNACAKNCYRAQCYKSATCMAEALELPDSRWSVAFQSRLGRAEWLTPSTEHTLEILAMTGKKKKNRCNLSLICRRLY